MARKFLVPVGVATAALAAGQVQAVVNTFKASTTDGLADLAGQSEKRTSGEGLHELKYQKGSEAHKLFMRKSESGMTFADHSSHSSHGSHGSHRSG